MNLKPFTGPGSTPSRRRFWDQVTQSVIASRKVAGRHVTVDEHIGKGTVINVDDTSSRRPPPIGPTGACCIDGECSILSADDCATAGGIYQGDETPCSPTPCMGCCCGIPFCDEGSVVCGFSEWVTGFTTLFQCNEIGGRFIPGATDCIGPPALCETEPGWNCCDPEPLQFCCDFGGGDFECQGSPCSESPFGDPFFQNN